MRSRSYQHLDVLAQALYLREVQKLQPLIAEEARIVQALQTLRAQGSGDTDADDTMRLIGAEASWQHWAATMRSRLNQQQAAVRARKLPAMEDMRRAFGRREALSELARQEERRRAEAARRKQDERLSSLIGLARMMAEGGKD